MAAQFSYVFLTILLCKSVFSDDSVIYKLDNVTRFQNVTDDEGNTYLADLWFKESDLNETGFYLPDTQNTYYLFTRNLYNKSQIIVYLNDTSLNASNFDASKRTCFLIHGWRASITALFIKVIVAAILAVADVNVIAVDWSAGAGTLNYAAASYNTVASGESVARFITWLNSVSGANVSSYHIIGFSLGAHQAGITGRNLGGNVDYITGLDPAGPGFITNPNRLQPNDSLYTEVIHTCAGVQGVLVNCGHVDFYPNGGITQTGCFLWPACNHARSYEYFGESILRGGYTGTRCETLLNALVGLCWSPGNLNMGGLTPKTGQSGIYWLKADPPPPYSQG